jgi:hypothetical protein
MAQCCSLGLDVPALDAEGERVLGTDSRPSLLMEATG